MRSLFISCLVLIVVSCAKKSTNVALNVDADQYRLNNVVISELDSTNQQFFNSNQSHLLAIQESRTASNRVNYIVIEISSLKIIKRGSFNPGYIKWKDETSLELLSAPGNIPKGKNLSDYITLITLSANNQ